MRKLSEYLFIWALGGCIYYSFELIFRGFSHWSMFGLGGICMVFCTMQGKYLHYEDPFWLQLLRCVIFVTSCEFITGMIVNKWLHWNVWDYGDQPLQIFGQICLPFAFIFSGLCSIGILLGGYILYWFYGEQKPRFYLSTEK